MARRLSIGLTVVLLIATCGCEDDDSGGLEVVLTKSFTGGPFMAGSQTTLVFTITNTSGAALATSIGFDDDLGATLPGLEAVGLPLNDVCGVGSLLSGTDKIIFANGTLAAGDPPCSFPVTVQIPAGAAAGNYLNVTSPIIADLDGQVLVGATASATLEVVGSLSFSKTFTDDPVQPGQTATLEFTITNHEVAQAATAITFTDNLNATLAGLAAVGLPDNDVCGAGSLLTGANLVALTAGSLPPGGSCTFSVTLQVPVLATAGTYPNTTSNLSGTVNAQPVVTSPATDDLVVQP
jgi:hypothetical protein